MIPDTSSTPKASASNKRVPRTAPLRSARGAEVRICAGAGGDREAAVGLTAVLWHESNIVKQHQQRGLVLVWLSMSGLMIFSLRLSHLTNWAGEHCFKLASQHSLPGKPVEEFLILPTHLPKIRSLDHQTWTSWDPHPLKRSRCIPRFLKQIATHQQKGIFQFPVSQPSRWNKSPDEASLSSDRPCVRNKTPVPEETRRSGTCPPQKTVPSNH